MKQLICVCLLAFAGLLSCSKSATESASASADSVTVKERSRFTIRLSSFWQDKKTFVLIIPNLGLDPVGLYSKPGDEKPAKIIADTVQTKILQRKKVKSSCDDESDREFYEVEIGGTRGWIESNRAFTVADLNIGSLNVDGTKFLKLGAMRKRWYDDGEYCHVVRTLFFYDDSFLYLIDMNPNNGLETSHIWETKGKREDFLSLVNYPEIEMINSTQIGKNFLTWTIPDGTVSMNSDFMGDHVEHSYYQMVSSEAWEEQRRGRDSVIAAEDPYAEDGAYGDYYDERENEHIEHCTFQDVRIGNCTHLVFSCDQFAIVELGMSDDQRKMWEDLTIMKDGVAKPNPDYIGKLFEIRYVMVDGDPCMEPNENVPYQAVPRITSFTTLDN